MPKLTQLTIFLMPIQKKQTKNNLKLHVSDYTVALLSGDTVLASYDYISVDTAIEFFLSEALIDKKNAKTLLSVHQASMAKSGTIEYRIRKNIRNTVLIKRKFAGSKLIEKVVSQLRGLTCEEALSKWKEYGVITQLEGNWALREYRVWYFMEKDIQGATAAV